MNPLRLNFTLACLALLAASSGVQAQSPRRSAGGGTGITDIMRAGPRAAAPQPTAAAPRADPGASSPAAQRPAEFIVALVNSEPITNTEVQARVTRALASSGNAAKMPRDQLTRLVLDRLISERAQLQVAKEDNLKIDELAIDQAEQTVARQNQLSVADLRREAQAQGQTKKEFREALRDQLLLLRLREREVEPKVKISDLEVEQFIRDQESRPNASIPPEINLAQILVAVPEGASPAQVAALKQRADGIAQRARGGEDFAKMARELSDAPDRANGGALGLRSAERYPPLLADATQSTAVGGIAGPILSGAGFEVLKVLARAQAGTANASATVTQTDVRHILLRTDDKRSTAQAVAQLADFKRRIEAGTADFAGLARDNSQDGSAKDGGDLGWRRSGEFVPEFEEAVDRLQPGQVSDPVVSRFGVHLIQVVGRRDVKLSAEDRRAAARAVLRERKLDDAYQAWAQEVRARAYVEYRDPPG